MAARAKAFALATDPDGLVRIKVPACGCNLSYRHIEDFPTRTTQCLCKNPDHLLVRYEFTD